MYALSLIEGNCFKHPLSLESTTVMGGYFKRNKEMTGLLSSLYIAWLTVDHGNILLVR
jgi:hypothetical protein